MKNKTAIFKLTPRTGSIVLGSVAALDPKESTSGAVTNVFAELLDIYPTLTERRGLGAPEHARGESLAPILRVPSASTSDSDYTVVTRPCMVSQWGGPNKSELNDLDKDPNEYHSLADNPEHEQVVRQLSRVNAEKRNALKYEQTN